MFSVRVAFLRVKHDLEDVMDVYEFGGLAPSTVLHLGKMRPWKYWVTDAAIEFKLTCFCELGQSCENSRSFIQKRNERVSCRGGNKERRVHNVTDDRQ